MRLIYSSSNPQEAVMLAGILKSDGIDTQMEMKKQDDWGSEQYGDRVATLWVINEDQVDQALRLIERFKENPPSIDPIRLQTPKTATNAMPQKFRTKGQQLTLFFIALCSIIFLITEMTAPTIPSTLPSYLPSMPFISSPTTKNLLFDYPQAFTIVDKLNKLYGPEKLEDPNSLPAEGKALIQRFQATPYWQGFYQIILERLHNITKPLLPLFEKLQQGEFWRLFTPALMHSGILHILFNMLWLIVLGKQIEERIGPLKYLAFVLFAGVATNTCQYLVGGVAFMGFSGIVCAMLTFICVRQKIAPWEGYPLEKSTSLFLLIFILSMGLIQLVSFGLEATETISVSPGIANTGHLSGAVLGALLGFLPIFARGDS